MVLLRDIRSNITSLHLEVRTEIENKARTFSITPLLSQRQSKSKNSIFFLVKVENHKPIKSDINLTYSANYIMSRFDSLSKAPFPLFFVMQ